MALNHSSTPRWLLVPCGEMEGCRVGVDAVGRAAYESISSWVEFCAYNDRCVEGDRGHPDTCFVLLSPEVGDEVATVGAINATRVVSLPVYNPEPGSRYLYVESQNAPALRDRMLELAYHVTVIPQTPRTETGAGAGMRRRAWFYKGVSCVVIRGTTPIPCPFRADRQLLLHLAEVTGGGRWVESKPFDCPGLGIRGANAKAGGGRA
jgi:hypothetical protein